MDMLALSQRLSDKTGETRGVGLEIIHCNNQMDDLCTGQKLPGVRSASMMMSKSQARQLHTKLTNNNSTNNTSVSKLFIQAVFPGFGTIKNGHLQLMYDLERRLRRKERIYIFSKQGHGRAGTLAACLLALV